MWSLFIFSVGGDTMMTAPWMLVLLVLTLHLQFHHTKYLLVKVDSGDKPGRVSSNSNKPVSRNSNKGMDWASHYNYMTEEDDCMYMIGA